MSSARAYVILERSLWGPEDPTDPDSITHYRVEAWSLVAIMYTTSSRYFHPTDGAGDPVRYAWNLTHKTHKYSVMYFVRQTQG